MGGLRVLHGEFVPKHPEITNLYNLGWVKWVEIWECPHCSLSFGSDTLLGEHVREDHEEE